MVDTTAIDLFLGLDLGKEFHHAHGRTEDGRTVHDKRLPNTEPKLLELFTRLVAKFGTVLVIVDQVANIGALPLTVARAAGCRVAYLPGLSMRRAADLHPGEAKTDARDAFVIAETARTMPHTLRAVDRDDEVLAELTMLTGYDNDLAGEVNRATNRLRGLLSQIHPSLERVLGPRLAYPYVQALLQRHGSPARLRKLGRAPCEALLKAHGSRKAHHLTAENFDALAEQTLVVPGTEASTLIVPGLAAQLAAAHTQRRQAEQEIAALLEALPLFHLLTSLPGLGVRTTAAVIVAIGDGTGFPTAGHLASYAGLAPATKSSGTSIRGEHAPHRGNRLLKRALFQAAFAAIGCKSDPSSRIYYDRQRARGKTHTQAILRLARQRVNMITCAICRTVAIRTHPSIRSASARTFPAEAWVAIHARTILTGGSEQAAASISTAADDAGLRPGSRKGIDDAVGYLKNKAAYLRYDTALTEGFPIATGIIEGACRHLVKDRLDITGARWGLTGAEAVLKLRALRSNGDLDTYWAWHETQEFTRNHQARYRDTLIPAA